MPWSSYISQRPGRSRYSVSSKIDIRTSFSLRYLLGGRRCWGSMPKAVEPGARGSFSRWTRWCGWLASLPRLPNFAGYSALLPIYFCAAPPGRYLVSCTAASITVGVFCLVASIRAQWRSHLLRFGNAHRASWSISLVFISRRMMPVGALLLGRHPWAASQRPENVRR